MDGRFEFCVVFVSKGFQADIRASRLTRTLGVLEDRIAAAVLFCGLRPREEAQCSFFKEENAPGLDGRKPRRRFGVLAFSGETTHNLVSRLFEIKLVVN